MRIMVIEVVFNSEHVVGRLGKDVKVGNLLEIAGQKTMTSV